MTVTIFSPVGQRAIMLERGQDHAEDVDALALRGDPSAPAVGDLWPKMTDGRADDPRGG
jgi:hypothetical protein